MTIIPLEPLPNQEFNIRLDNFRYKIRLNTVDDTCLCATISRDDVPLIDGNRATSNTVLIPYRYLEGDGGNFAFVTPNDELPQFEQLGTTHILVYYSRAELDALNGEMLA